MKFQSEGAAGKARKSAIRVKTSPFDGEITQEGPTPTVRVKIGPTSRAKSFLNVASIARDLINHNFLSGTTLKSALKVDETTQSIHKRTT